MNDEIGTGNAEPFATVYTPVETKKVLDKGYVRLVSSMGGDWMIVDAARVSHNNDHALEDEEKDKKLIRYLLANRHTSPFEHVVFTFEVKAPIFVFRQWHRHRTWSYNEISGRYTELDEGSYIPETQHIGKQSKSNKQARDITVTDVLTYEVDREDELRWYELEIAWSDMTYKDLLAAGWPRELARCVLPLATYSRMYATVDLHNLLHFITLRDDRHSQFEIREYAKALKELITPIVPITMEVWNELQNQ